MIRVKVLGSIEKDRFGMFENYMCFEHGSVYYPVTETTIIAERNLTEEKQGIGTTGFFRQATMLLDDLGFVKHDKEDCPVPCLCLPKTEEVFIYYLEYQTDPHQVYLVDPKENNRLRTLLKRPDPFHRVAEILEHHLEVGLDLAAVQANAAEHAAENDKKRARKNE